MAAAAHAPPKEVRDAQAPSMARRVARAGIDFDLHGVVGIRLYDANAHDAAAVSRQLGPLRRRLDREPDIVIRFVDRIDGRRSLTLVGDEDAGFADDEFVLLWSRHRAPARSAVPLHKLGGRLEIRCEHGIEAIPQLVPFLNLLALSKGVLPLHASAFVHDGVGVVVTGWSRAGKTDALLGFVRRGASYVGDDWVYVSEDGRCILGLPEPVRLWDWQLRSAPTYRSALSTGERVRLGGMYRARKLARALPVRAHLRNRVDALVRRQLGVEIAPERLFGPDALATRCGFDVLFLAACHESNEITVEPIDPLEVALRMTYSLQYERRQLCETYQKFRFSFPLLASTLLERADELERRLLRRTFVGKPAFVVRHPSPVRDDALADAMSVYCRLP
jgi:hypothetical protein